MGRTKLNEKQRQRLKAIRLSEKVGVTGAAKRSGISRVMLHRYIKRYHEEGVEGLSDRSHRPHHPATTPPEVAEFVVSVALNHPTRGCRKLVGAMKEKGTVISEPTVQGILINHNLGRIEERIAYLENGLLSGDIQPSLRLLSEIESADPVFRERYCTGKRPGDLLVMDILRSGLLEDNRRLFIAVVIDTASSFEWAYPHIMDDPLPHCEILHQQVLPDLANWNIRARVVMAPDKWPWTGESHEARSFEFWRKEAWGLRHRVDDRDRPNGFSEGVRVELKAWFRRAGMHGATLEEVDQALVEWAVVQNSTVRWMYPCFGQSPVEMIATSAKICSISKGSS